ncbi:MAG: class II fructose-bisphosphate aldolase [Chloroflexi bacterium]|nr:class II fructose-bisphosphate aldolase [Anaerolineaceae bacterium]NMB88266.1 class II fructose-bisphosphate aldolase [Chloroflexota bacterium]
MPIVPFKEILKDAFDKRYGVAAFNIVNDLTLDAVLSAAEDAHSPVIIQTSVKTVKMIGVDVLYAMWKAMASKAKVPTCIHLDHCPDRAMISACLAEGWDSVLFDASSMPLEENRRQTVEVVAEAQRYGAGVEGEIEGIRGVEDGVGSDAESDRKTLEASLDFVRVTGVDCFAPAIGNAHGVYLKTPTLDVQRVSDITNTIPIPIALHGGTGLTKEQFQDLIARGCAKVNISTALKITYMQSNLAYLREAETKNKWDPLSQFTFVRKAVKEMVSEYLTTFGSVGRA